jgi:hypothetical protein
MGLVDELQSDEFFDAELYFIAPRVELTYSYARDPDRLPLLWELRYPQMVISDEDVRNEFGGREKLDAINAVFADAMHGLTDKYSDEVYWTYSITRADTYFISVLFSGYKRVAASSSYDCFSLTIDLKTGERSEK